MTVQAAIFPLSLTTLFDQNGCPIKGGRLYFADAGTTTARTVYKNSALTLAHTYPVRTDSYGRIPPIYIGTSNDGVERNYKVTLKDNQDALIGEFDDLVGGTIIVPATEAVSDFNTGDLKASYSSALQNGWLPLNGRTIGNANSIGTARANDDCQALFVSLWNGDPNLVVSNGRGISAAADFAAAKTIALPTAQGRTLVGVDGMGAASLAGVITAATTATPDQIGTLFGSETVTLTEAELPEITDGVTLAPAGGFTPAGTLDQQGNHTHTGTTDAGGAHTHIVETAQIAASFSAPNTRGVQGGGLTDQGTDSAGVHQHTFTTALNGLHTHTFTGTAQPDHDHAVTVAIGDGDAHSNTQPSILVYIHIKL